MLSVDDALTICRTLAGLADDPSLPKRDNIVANAVERLLVELAISQDESSHYRDLLHQWGIPAKRRKLIRIVKGGFEAGWE